MPRSRDSSVARPNRPSISGTRLETESSRSIRLTWTKSDKDISLLRFWRRGYPLRVEREVAMRDQMAVTAQRAAAEARPDVPVVAAARQAHLPPVEHPARPQLQVRRRGPDAQDLPAPAVELDVVVLRALHTPPVEARRL